MNLHLVAARFLIVSFGIVIDMAQQERASLTLLEFRRCSSSPSHPFFKDLPKELGRTISLLRKTSETCVIPP